MGTEKKDGFDSKIGFILACVGSAVGMGNIWRFPIMVSKFGGLTFLIPYFIFVVLIGSTGVIEEMAFGRATGFGPIGAFGTATELRGKGRKLGEMIGLIPVLGSMALAIGYSCVIGWIFKYTWMAISGGLHSMGTDMDVIGGTFGMTASAWGATGQAQMEFATGPSPSGINHSTSKSHSAAAYSRDLWAFRAASATGGDFVSSRFAIARYSIARMHWLEPSVP